MFKKQTGITLVALVITIIVLLILAGVSISMVIGNNGVLTQASTSVMKTKASEARQAVQLALQTAETKYYAERTGNSAITRTEIYATAVSEELTNQGYTVTSTDNVVSTSLVNVVIVKGAETYTVPVMVGETTGAVDFGTVLVGGVAVEL